MKWLRKIWQTVNFLLFYLGEVLISNLRVAYDVLTPKDHSDPSIIALPLEARTDLELLVVANLISMTPGTLSMDVSSDRQTLYIHTMFTGDVEELKRGLKENFEARVLRLLRD